MQDTLEVLLEDFENINGTWTFKFEDRYGAEYELCFEPLMFDGQMYVALYKNKILMTGKIPVKIGK